MSDDNKFENIEEVAADFKKFATDSKKNYNTAKVKNKKKEALDFKRERKRVLRKKINDMSNGKWNILEEMLQEIQATAHIGISTLGKLPLTKQIGALKESVERDYADDPDTLEILLEGIPSIGSVRKWVKKAGWKKAVDEKIKDTLLYSSENRAKVNDQFMMDLLNAPIQYKTSLYKLYFEMGGDLKKNEINQQTNTSGIEEFRKKASE